MIRNKYIQFYFHQVKTFVFVLSVLLTGYSVSAQSVVSSGGTSFTSATGGQIQFTIGETITTVSADRDGRADAGFQALTLLLDPNLIVLPSDATQDVVDDETLLQLNVYPNPTTELITIHFKDYRRFRYTLFDSHGSAIKTGNLSSENTAVDVSDIATGNYFLNLHDSEKIQSINFTINKQ